MLFSQSTNQAQESITHMQYYIHGSQATLFLRTHDVWFGSQQWYCIMIVTVLHAFCLHSTSTIASIPAWYHFQF